MKVKTLDLKLIYSLEKEYGVKSRTLDIMRKNGDGNNGRQIQ